MKRVRNLLFMLAVLPIGLWWVLCQPLSPIAWGGEKSDHFDGRRFFNPDQPSGRLFNFVRWQLTRNPAQWPQWVDINHSSKPPERVGSGDVRVTYINHATVLIQMDGYNILTDPVYAERVSPFPWAGPKRVHSPGISFDDLPLIDIVLISHNHYDSLDLETLKRLSLHHRTALILTGLGNLDTVREAVTDPVRELDWWEHFDDIGGLRITFVPAQHFSQRTLCDYNKSLWGGFVIEGSSGRVYFAGDSGYGPHFSSIREKLGPPRLAILPIGAYSPEWFMQSVHINPEEALQAHFDLAAEASMAIHFGTFQLSDESIDEPASRLLEEMQRRDVPSTEFIIPVPGTSWVGTRSSGL